MTNEPVASRPQPDWLGGKDLLPWSWAVERLTAERNYWIVTGRRDGFPQARPLWGVWMGDALYITVGHAGVQRAADDPRVTVHVDSAVDVVIVEGTYERATELSGPATPTRAMPGISQATLDSALEIFNRKYTWNLEAGWLNFLVRPRLVYGWRDEDVKTATKWTFTTD